MPRKEEDKEDLITDGTALIHRAEFFCADAPWKVVTVGYRFNGFLSVYLDQDPFYQFDDHGRLRRALMNGLLYRSQGQSLVELTRDRSSHERTVLARRDLSQSEQQQFVTKMKSRLATFHSLLAGGELRLGRRITQDAEFDDRLAGSLTQVIRLSAAESLSGSINAR